MELNFNKLRVNFVKEKKTLLYMELNFNKLRVNFVKVLRYIPMAR